MDKTLITFNAGLIFPFHVVSLCKAAFKHKKSPMKLYIDNQALRSISTGQKKFPNSLLAPGFHLQLTFARPSLLEYINEGFLFNSLPAFGPGNKFYDLCITTLSSKAEQELLFYLFDSLFAECLVQIKGLPQVNAVFLLHHLHAQRENPALAQVNKLFSQGLTLYEKVIWDDPDNAIHDLTLYLAWDRMCVCISNLFDYPSSNPNFIRGVSVLKECLIESFQHITQQGRTAPSLYRLIEALYFYEMREENLQTHSDTDWAVLSQGINALKSKTDLADFYDIDMALTNSQSPQVQDPITVLTLDSEEQINARLALANAMLNKLKNEVPNWNYTLNKVIHINL